MASTPYTDSYQSMTYENIPEKAMKVFELISNHGFKVYFIGGCVRDMIMGIEPKDWDMCCDAKPDELAALFNENGIKIDPTGFEFGTVVADFDDEKYEVCTFGEGTDIKDNAICRDFSMNALAYNPLECKIYDYTGGIEDIKNKIIRSNGDPYENFCNDPFRIIRAIRFSLEFGFSIEEKTYQTMLDNYHLLANARSTRITREVGKILKYAEHIFRK